MLLAVGGFSASTTGCATPRLPWLAKKQETTEMENYVAQASQNIKYEDTDVVFSDDYQPEPRSSSSYTSPPATRTSRSGGGGGSCCH
jgi:hypothetical protein